MSKFRAEQADVDQLMRAPICACGTHQNLYDDVTKELEKDTKLGHDFCIVWAFQRTMFRAGMLINLIQADLKGRFPLPEEEVNQKVREIENGANLVTSALIIAQQDDIRDKLWRWWCAMHEINYDEWKKEQPNEG